MKIFDLTEDEFCLEALRKAYRQKAKECHPDKNNNSPESTKEFVELSEAYAELLKKFDDKSLRDLLDNQGKSLMNLMRSFTKWFMDLIKILFWKIYKARLMNYLKK
jgi:DnaJ-class molecular chaperone